MTDHMLVGGIELGGTKTVLAVGLKDGTILDSASLPTVEPEAIVEQAAAYFADVASRLGPVCAIGAGAFGPVVIDELSPDFGCLLETNKPGWSGFQLHRALAEATGCRVRLVTDVGAAGIAEADLGALREVDLGIYLTVGTGIGGAILCHGRLLPAVLHPELGHLPLRRQGHDMIQSACGFHDHCAEGLAAGPAIARRFGMPLNLFAADGPEVGLIADYLGQLCAALILTLSPRRIVIGGGVAKSPGLLENTRVAMLRHLNGYAVKGAQGEDFVCPPELGDRAGIVGALLAATRVPSSGTRGQP